MLLSSSRTKKKKEGNSDVASRKSPRVSRNQTARLIETPMQENSDSDDSDTTHSRRATGSVKAEINLKIRYKFEDKDKEPHRLHVQFLQFMITNINFNITAYNKKHEALKVTDIMTLTGPEKYKNNFEVKVSERDKNEEIKQAVIIQTIQSNSTLSFIKKQPGVIEFLKGNKIQISIHEWTQSIWDVNVVGFLTKFSPAHHPKDFVLATLKTRLNKQTMPHFKIKQTSILSEINNRKIRIQVYAIEVQNKDTRQAEKQLMKHDEDPVEFVSFRMRKINTEAYQTAIALVAQHQKMTYVPS